MEGSPKGGKGGKKNYQVCSSHRRMVSHLMFREEDWSEGEGLGCGFGSGKARSWDHRTPQGSALGLIFPNNADMEGESQLRLGGNRGKQLKVSESKKELVTQLEVEVSHSMKEGSILDKLVEMEDKAVKFKVSKEGARLS